MLCYVFHHMYLELKGCKYYDGYFFSIYHIFSQCLLVAEVSYIGDAILAKKSSLGSQRKYCRLDNS